MTSENFEFMGFFPHLMISKRNYVFNDFRAPKKRLLPVFELLKSELKNASKIGKCFTSYFGNDQNWLTDWVHLRMLKILIEQVNFIICKRSVCATKRQVINIRKRNCIYSTSFFIWLKINIFLTVYLFTFVMNTIFDKNVISIEFVLSCTSTSISQLFINNIFYGSRCK